MSGQRRSRFENVVGSSRLPIVVRRKLAQVFPDRGYETSHRSSERIVASRPLRRTTSQPMCIRAAVRARVAADVSCVVGTARMLWKFAVARGYVPRNIAKDVAKPRVERAIESGVIDENILDPAEIEQLVAAAPEEHRDEKQCGDPLP